MNSTLFLVALILAPCIADSSPAMSSPRFLALGDSYTIGESVAPDQRWPAQLVNQLRVAGIAIDDPITIAKTGWTTDELSAAIDAANPQGTFDLVSLLIGVNNQYRGRSSEEFRKEFRALLQRAIAFAGHKATHVVVVSIPDWGATPFANGKDREKIAGAIDLFNDIVREEAVRGGAKYVNITPITRRVPTDATLVAQDGLHPSAAMYGAWVKLLIPVATKILQP